MRNYINKNINTSIKWDWEGKKPRKGRSLHKGQKIIGLNIFDKEQKSADCMTGYCGSIELSGDVLQIWTNGKYQFIKKEIAIKLLGELLKRLQVLKEK